MYHSKIKQGMAMVSICALLLSGCSVSTEESSTETVVGENQSVVYGIVTSIQGNEITYMEVEESVIQEQLGTDDTETSENTDSKENTGSMESTEEGSTEQSTGRGGGRGQGTRPDMSEDGTGEMGTESETSGDGAGEMGTPPDMSGDASGETESAPTRDKGMNMAGESVTTQIPVGVVVHTASDTETTFSRIVSGDILKILMETDADGNQVIVEIWMLQ